MDTLIQRILEGEAPGLEEIVEAWETLFPLLGRLEGTPQDPEWHAEGNVFIHTAMVLEETYGIAAELLLPPERRLVLVLGAIFHDIAKPVTTRRAVIKEVERVIAPHHARRGASYLATPILELGLEPCLARKVIGLVGHHHDPRQLVINNSPAESYRRLAEQADTELLYHLELADMRGRHCKDQQEQIDLIELFALHARRHDTFGVRSSRA